MAAKKRPIMTRERVLQRQRQRRDRASMSPEEKRARRQADQARCCDLPWLESMCTKDPETGCWLWQGPWKRIFQTIQPQARKGRFGAISAVKAAWLASRKTPVPEHHSLGRTCGNDACIAPTHLCLENAVLRAAKKRRSDHVTQEGIRPRPGADEPGDDRRCG